MDNSTFCDAYRASAREGVTQQSDAGYAPLYTWVDRVATEANLCLSPWHLRELSKAPPAFSTPMARWYEQLPIVWTCAYTDLDDLEADYWMLKTVGMTPAPVTAFAPSFMTAFSELRPSDIADLLAEREPIVALVRHSAVADPSKELDGMKTAADFFRRDAEWASEQHWSADDTSGRQAANHRAVLHMMAQESKVRLRHNDEFVRRAATQDVASRFGEIVTNDPMALAHMTALQRLTRGFMASAARKKPGGGKEASVLSGAFADMMHAAVGATYCDVFTCDATVSQMLGDFRTSIGLRKQLAVGGHPGGVSGFVRDLMSAWP